MIAEYNAIIASDSPARCSRAGRVNATAMSVAQIMYGYNGDMSMETSSPRGRGDTRGSYIGTPAMMISTVAPAVRDVSASCAAMTWWALLRDYHAQLDSVRFLNLVRVPREGLVTGKPARDAKGVHCSPAGSRVASIYRPGDGLKSYEDAEYLVLATRGGMVRRVSLKRLRHEPWA